MADSPPPSQEGPSESHTNTSRSMMGTGVAWKFRNQSKGEFLAGNRTQTG
jgi:hypothetical protein